MSNFLDLQKKRRSIYALGDNTGLSNEAIVSLVESTVEQSPSAFHSETSRLVFLFGDKNKQFWNELTANALEKVTPADNFAATKEKLASFSKGQGTILLFEDQSVVKGLQEQFPLYADNFPIWSEQAHGIALYAIWLAFAEKNIGMNIQHYNPLIDQEVHRLFDIPSDWKLRGQAPFGSIEAPAQNEKTFKTDNRYKVFGN